MFNLAWDPSHERGGTDAHFDVSLDDGRSVRVDVEVKSTTGDSVSTARDVGRDHILKWRGKFWVIGFYSKGRSPELQRCLCLPPDTLEPWIKDIEDKIGPDFAIADRASANLTAADVANICGAKPLYTMQDAKRLHKRQWSSKQYSEAADVLLPGKKKKTGISPAKMLEILQLRAKYIAERGATLNNPHIPKTILNRLFGTPFEIAEGEWASSIRRIAKEYIQATPTHPFQTMSAAASVAGSP